jgi:hypothetical protein
LSLIASPCCCLPRPCPSAAASRTRAHAHAQFSGADVLANPEPGFFILGSKSYGRCAITPRVAGCAAAAADTPAPFRNSAFLLRIGLQQVAAAVDAMCPPQPQPQ